MNDHQQINDSALTRELRESLTGIAAPQRPPLETITARGRTRQRHRRTGIAGLSAAGVAAGTALALGLTGVLGSAPARSTGTIRTAAFTVVEHANGTATVTINNADELLMNPGALQSALQQDGIPALVRGGSFCSSAPVPAGLAQVVALSDLSLPYSPAHGPTRPAPAGGSLTINPAAMPAGAELSFGVFQLRSLSRIETITELIDTNSYTCTSTAPPAPPPGQGDLVVFQQYVPAGS
jgi:hypothetical protein